MALTDNLVAWWTLDESSGTRVDSHDNGNDLSDNNTVGSGTGKKNGSASFVAANSEYLSIAHASQTQLDLRGGWWTVQCWFKLNTGGDSVMGIAHKYAGSNPGGWLIRISDTRIIINIARNGSSSSMQHNWSSTLNTGQWYHLIYGNDPQNGHDDLYLDGNGDLNTGGAPFLGNGIGANTTDVKVGVDHGSAYFDGEIDELAFWLGRHLTTDEYAELYNNGDGVTYSDFAGGGVAGTARRLHLMGM